MSLTADRTRVAPRSSVPGILVWAGLSLLALAGTWFLILAWQEGLSGGRDFVQDFAAILKIGQGRNPYEPYNDVTQWLFGGAPHRGPLYSFHAPSSLPLLVWLLPFALQGGYTGAFLAWGAVSLASLWAICWLSLRAIGVPRPGLSGLLFALALNMLPAIRENFEEGQLNVVVAAGMVGCWAARRSGRSGLAGLLLGAAFALKPIPGLFFVYYLWRRDWRLLGFATGTLVVLSVLGVGLAGVDGARDWATVNYPSHASVWPGYPDNASVRGFFTRIFGPSEWRPRPPINAPAASLLLWMAAGGLLTLAALRATRAGQPEPTEHDGAPSNGLLDAVLTPPPLAVDAPRNDLEIAVLTILSVLVAPIVWPHYYVVLVMPIIAIAVVLGRLVGFGAPAPEGKDAGAATAAHGATPYDRRRRLVPTIALFAMAVAVAVLANAHYVEPFQRVGGQQLIALLVVYAAGLVALWWSAWRQGEDAMPDAAR